MGLSRGLFASLTLACGALLSASFSVLVSSCGQAYSGEDADAGAQAHDSPSPDLDATADAPQPPSSDASAVDGGDAQPLVPFATCALAEAGPDFVLIPGGGYCIDATEVTNDQYYAFIASKDGDMTGQRAGCEGNTTYAVPGVPPTAGTEHQPVRYPDFCDAVAYCEWAGKRLCGAIDPKHTLVATELANASVDQWYRACSKDGDPAHALPYGPAFNASACNSFESGINAPTNVGSILSCQGGYPGIFDMAGNVSEWVDACEQDGGAINCYSRGGDYGNGYADPSSCAFVKSPAPILAAAATNGFRCCSK